MTTQELYELADKEIQMGIFDRPLMQQAMTEANGVKVHAHQIYWRLRSNSLQETAKKISPHDTSLYLQEIRAKVDSHQKARRFRADLIGWMWVIACLVCFVATVVFWMMAKAAWAHSSGSFYTYAILGLVSLIVAIAGYIIAKKDAGHDPF